MKLELTDNPVYYNGRRVGQMVLNPETGRISFCRWSTLLRFKDSYAISCDLAEEVNARIYYVVDKDDNSLWKFRREDYLESEIDEVGGELQFLLPRSENIGFWEDADDVLSG